jgi:hypothetical protein
MLRINNKTGNYKAVIISETLVMALICLISIHFIINTITLKPVQTYHNQSINAHKTITCKCDIITNYDNIVEIEYKGNSYKCYVKDGNNYNNATKALITFKTTKSLLNYKIIDIKPL